MNVMFLGGILMLILFFGGLVLAGLAIWALATKKDTLPQWGKIMLWVFVVLAGMILITGIVCILVFVRKILLF